MAKSPVKDEVEAIDQIENPNRYAVTTLEVSRGGIYDADIQFLQGPSVNDVSALRWEGGFCPKADSITWVGSDSSDRGVRTIDL